MTNTQEIDEAYRNCLRNDPTVWNAYSYYDKIGNVY